MGLHFSAVLIAVRQQKSSLGNQLQQVGPFWPVVGASHHILYSLPGINNWHDEMNKADK